MSTETAAWPIRVGGVYQFAGLTSISGRVTAIDGNTVYLDTLQHGVKYGSEELSVNTFRDLYVPEDQSPIPALVAALTAVQWGNGRCVACQRTQEEGHYEGCAVAEALAKAGAR